METIKKELYETPTIDVVEVKMEGNILQMSGRRGAYDPDSEGGFYDD